MRLPCGKISGSRRSAPARPVSVSSVHPLAAAAATARPLRAEPWLLVAGILSMLAGSAVHAGGLDIPAFLAVQALTLHLPDALWSGLSVLGLGLCVLAIAGVASPRDATPALVLLFAVVIGGLLLQAVKHTLALPRPLQVLPEGGLHWVGAPLRHGSMPSGHSAAWAALAAVLATAWWPQARGRAVAVVVLAVFGGVARMAVGAHWPSDVLVGAGLGLVSVVIGARLHALWQLDRRLRGPTAQRVLALAQGALGIAVIVANGDYPLGAVLQYVLGAASLWAGAERWQHAAEPRS